MVRVVVWGVGILFLFMLANVAEAARERSQPDVSHGPGYAAGFVFGTVVGAFLVAAVIRWVYLRVRRRPGAIRSVWLLGISAALLLANVAVATNLPVAPVNTAAAATRVADRLHIASPYRLGPAGEQATKALLDPLVAESRRLGFRAGEIRAILSGADTIGYLVVIDINMHSGEAEGYLTGFMESASSQGGTARRDEIAGHALGIVSTADATLVSWVETPLIMTLVGFDEPETMRMTRATLAPAP